MIHTYAYVGNKPTNRVDPLRWKECPPGSTPKFNNFIFTGCLTVTQNIPTSADVVIACTACFVTKKFPIIGRKGACVACGLGIAAGIGAVLNCIDRVTICVPQKPCAPPRK